MKKQSIVIEIIKASSWVKRSFKLGEDLWHIQVPQLNDEPADAKIEVSVEDKSTSSLEV